MSQLIANPWLMLGGFTLGVLFPGFMFGVFVLGAFASREGVIAFLSVVLVVYLAGLYDAWESRKIYEKKYGVAGK